MKVKVNNDSCIGCGACAAVCPEVFEIEDTGYAVAKGEVTPELEAKVQDAKDGCPAGAIEDAE
jgi:ferredoxin